jgi:hypothetical protein
MKSGGLGWSFNAFFPGTKLTDVPAVSADGLWPMKVEDFIQRDYMKYSDIVLTRKEWNLTSWLIRTATGGNFAHSSLVFLTPHWQYGWQSTFLIESVFSGTEITAISDYFKHKNLSIAIKRLNRPWFDERLAKLVRGRMLDDIKAEYAFNIVWRLARQFLFGFEGAVRGHRATIRRRRSMGYQSPNEFICSGFMQVGYLRAISEHVREGTLPPSVVRDVIFDDDLAHILHADWNTFTPDEQRQIVSDFLSAFNEELMAVTPRDIELHDAFDWQYVVTGGYVYPVSSYAEVCRLLSIEPLQPDRPRPQSEPPGM